MGCRVLHRTDLHMVPHLALGRGDPQQLAQQRPLDLRGRVRRATDSGEGDVVRWQEMCAMYSRDEAPCVSASAPECVKCGQDKANSGKSKGQGSSNPHFRQAADFNPDSWPRL